MGGVTLFCLARERERERDGCVRWFYFGYISLRDALFVFPSRRLVILKMRLSGTEVRCCWGLFLGRFGHCAAFPRGGKASLGGL